MLEEELISKHFWDFCAECPDAIRNHQGKTRLHMPTLDWWIANRSYDGNVRFKHKSE